MFLTPTDRSIRRPSARAGILAAVLAAASFAHAQSAPAAPPADLDQLAAYQLTSIAGNVVITQLVDQKVGVHVKRPKGIFQ